MIEFLISLACLVGGFVLGSIFYLGALEFAEIIDEGVAAIKEKIK